VSHLFSPVGVGFILPCCRPAPCSGEVPASSSSGPESQRCSSLLWEAVNAGLKLERVIVPSIEECCFQKRGGENTLNSDLLHF